MMRNRMLLLLLVICLLLSGCSGSSDRDIKSEYMDPGTIAQNEYRTTKVTRGDFQIDFQDDLPPGRVHVLEIQRRPL